MRAPTIDYLSLSPLLAVAAGSILCLMAGLFRPRVVQRVVVPLLAAGSLATAIVLVVVVWRPGDTPPLVSGALAMDTLTLASTVIFCVAGLATILLALRSEALLETGSGEWLALMLASILGMILLAGAENLVTLFLGIELLSIPLYVLCATQAQHRASLESGLKYLVIGSVGSATLLYGLALVYGATGATGLPEIAAAIRTGRIAGDPLLLTGIALSAAGLAFKGSVAPFHQWTPDVYQGAPTPVTAFMAVATKASAFAIFLRLFDSAFPSAQIAWGPALAALAVTTILIGNFGAITQDSLKRMLAWSGVAQAGYLLAGVVVGTRLGLEATMFYLAVYLPMNVAAFAVIAARERVSEHGDDIRSIEGLAAASPALAIPMTVAMFALAGFPFTGGFIGKFQLIRATVEGDYAFLGVAIVVGSMISLVYYLRVVAAMWMGPFEVRLPTGRLARPVAGWSPEADARAQPEVTVVAVTMSALIIAIGIWPEPLFQAAEMVGTSLSTFVG